MGALFGAPKPTPAPLPSKTDNPVDADALARARQRAEQEKARKGRQSMRVDPLQSTVAATSGSGVMIP